jgi:hypothetical protein
MTNDGAKLSSKIFLNRVDGIFFSSIVYQSFLFLCCLWQSNNRSAIFLVISATACWWVVGSSGDGKFNVSFAKVSTASLLGIPQWLGIHWKTISKPFVEKFINASEWQ